MRARRGFRQISAHAIISARVHGVPPHSISTDLEWLMSSREPMEEHGIAIRENP
jgi:hypothetical protein